MSNASVDEYKKFIKQEQINMNSLDSSSINASNSITSDKIDEQTATEKDIINDLL